MPLSFTSHRAPILSKRGYSDPDLDAIFHGNFVRFFRRALPA